ncbi:MAG TPA: hypothetical protein VNR38_08445 [Ureibacillus sp.]|nr:hypothetical protein [Ureibacillus sp.]
MNEQTNLKSKSFSEEEREKFKIEILSLLEDCSKEDLELAVKQLKKKKKVG